MFKKLLKRDTADSSAKDRVAVARNYDVVLHIGAPKTGSSAIQRFLNNHRDVLKGKGYHYPEHPVNQIGISAGHSSLTKACQQRRLDDAKAIFNKWLAEAQRGGLTLLLSSEPFINLAQPLKAIIGNRSLLVIAYQRDIVEFLASEHNQLVKNAFETRSFEDYILGHLDPFRKAPRLVKKPFSETYAEWAEYAGPDNLIVKLYDTSRFQQQPIEQDFLLRLGIVVGDDFSFDRAPTNVSYTRHALELKRMLNHVLGRGEEKLNKKIEHLLQTFSQKNKTSSNGTVFLQRETYLRLMDFLYSDYQALEQQFLKQALRKRHLLGENVLEEVELRTVLDALSDHADIAKYLRNAVQARLASRTNLTYSVYRLAQFLQIEGLERYENKDNNGWFEQRHIALMLEGRFDEADFLREIAALASRRGDFEQARALIDRAVALRPKGQVIRQLRDLIEQQCKNGKP